MLIHLGVLVPGDYCTALAACACIFGLATGRRVLSGRLRIVANIQKLSEFTLPGPATAHFADPAEMVRGECVDVGWA